MKNLLTLIVFISIGYCNESNYDFTGEAKGSFSYGLFSEKMGITFFEYSKLINIDKQSEYYLSAWTMIMGTSIGLGYKKYFKLKDDNILFLNTGSHFSLLGTLDEGMSAFGFNLSPGKRIKYGESGGSFINIGLSFMYMIAKEPNRESKEFIILPFINLEKRF